MHLFLSPHLDDVALSCGGLVYRLVQGGASVLILTIMAGDPPTPLPDSPIIHDLHNRWEAGYNPMPARREEDRCATECLGADSIHLPIPDCVYRTAGAQALYPTEESLFGKVALADHAHTQLISTPLPLDTEIATLYVPLAIGHHVDHQIVRDWGLSLAEAAPQLPVKFYEDYPYSRDKIAIDQTIQRQPEELKSELVALSEADITAKIEAIACYKSQLSTFWTDAGAMMREIRHDAEQTGQGTPAERYWMLLDT